MRRLDWPEPVYFGLCKDPYHFIMISASSLGFGLGLSVGRDEALARQQLVLNVVQKREGAQQQGIIRAKLRLKLETEQDRVAKCKCPTVECRKGDWLLLYT